MILDAWAGWMSTEGDSIADALWELPTIVDGDAARDPARPPSIFVEGIAGA